MSEMTEFIAVLVQHLLAGQCTERVSYVHGPMGSGKSEAALEVLRLLRRSGRAAIVLIAGTEPRTAIISRSGGRLPGHPARRIVDRPDFITNDCSFLVIDEAQFLRDDEVLSINQLASNDRIQTICFGLYWDSDGRLFQGTRSLLDSGARALSLPHELRCWCGSPAVGDVIWAAGKRKYVSACIEHKGLRL